MFNDQLCICVDDFKPKSVDSSQPGRLKVEGEEVTVSLPLFQVLLLFFVFFLFSFSFNICISSVFSCVLSFSPLFLSLTVFSIYFPIQAESLDDVAMFRGAKRPVQKECILMIDKVTGVSRNMLFAGSAV